MCIQHPGHGLQLVEDDPAQVVVPGAGQQDHVEVAAHQGDVVHFAVLFFIREKLLASAVEHDVLSESIAEGNILITADDDEAAAAVAAG